MDIQSEKIDLAKRLLDTENESIINAVKSVLDSFDSNHDWADLPEKVIKDIKESLDQIEAGKEISLLEARETYKKWL